MPGAVQGWTKTVYGVADDLKSVIKDIEGYCDGKFVLFYGYADGASTRYWNRAAGGTDYKKFLEVARKLDVKMIYLNAARVSGNEAVAAMGHKDEFSYITMCFFYDQMRYVFYIDSNWYMYPPEKPIEKPESPSLSGYR
jgi:hypothetical protein